MSRYSRNATHNLHVGLRYNGLAKQHERHIHGLTRNCTWARLIVQFMLNHTSHSTIQNCTSLLEVHSGAIKTLRVNVQKVML